MEPRSAGSRRVHGVRGRSAAELVLVAGRDPAEAPRGNLTTRGEQRTGLPSEPFGELCCRLGFSSPEPVPPARADQERHGLVGIERRDLDLRGS